MYQELEYDLDEVMPLARETGLFDSLCTVQICTNTVDLATGQVDLTPTGFADIPGCVDIPCMRAPASYARIVGNEIQTPQMAETTNLFHVLLDDYFPQIKEAVDSTAQNQAIIDGILHQVNAVESDSQKKMTRLLCEQVGV